jgi:hypothetical protein
MIFGLQIGSQRIFRREDLGHSYPRAKRLARADAEQQSPGFSGTSRSRDELVEKAVEENRLGKRLRPNDQRS